jgi:curved DNA-binding protein CbpA
MNLEEALRLLEFDDVRKLPRMKDIVKQWRKLSMMKHPDKNGGTKESTSDF